VFQLLIDAAMKSGRRDVVGAMIAHETATRAVPCQRGGSVDEFAIVPTAVKEAARPGRDLVQLSNVDSWNISSTATARSIKP
jgi:hypothetical protein